MKKLLQLLLVTGIMSCNHNNTSTKTTEKMSYPTTGSIEKIDPLLDSIIAPGTQAEIIAEGMDWSEGPVWVESQQMLLFSDVPRDSIFKWTEAKGKELYLTPSGYTGSLPRGGEMGSNGLLLDKEGRLVLCQCGNRQMARMDAALDNPQPNYTRLANLYEGKHFNSPNDAVYNQKGELFFTDPPYGLEKQMNDPLKEIPFQGVYRVKTDGTVDLVTDSLTRPNGIGFLPGDKTLLIANSDNSKPNWYAIDVNEDGTFSNGRIFMSAMLADKSVKGLPDGFKVDKNGTVFASGPGGIWIFTKEAKLLGKIKLPEAVSNIALSADEKTMYVTNDMQVLRIKMRN